MFEAVRQYIIKNGALIDIAHYDGNWMGKGKTVYEVMRVINEKVLFINEHVDRLERSASLAGYTSELNKTSILQNIDQLIEANAKEDGNILIGVKQESGQLMTLAYYIPHHYPDNKDYEQGVNVCTMKAVRSKPAAKVWNPQLRKKAGYLMERKHAYEILLIDTMKNITEGSKSNIFFIRGNTLFTPPKEKVLSGITREKVLELGHKLFFKIAETDIPLADLVFFESAFLTGTSPKVLPVKQIDKITFNTSNAKLRELMSAYDQLIS